MNEKQNAPRDEALKAREEKLQARLKRIQALEDDIKEREKKLKEKEKKQVLLRLSPSLWEEIAQWANEDFRSINGQIEYLLTTSVEKRKKGNR